MFATAVDPLCRGANPGVLAELRFVSPSTRAGQHLVLTVSVVVACFVTGCAGLSTTPPASQPSSSSMSKPADDVTGVRAAYDRFWAVGNAEPKQDPAQWNDAVAAVATNPELDTMLTNLASLRTRSLVVYGTTRSHVEKVDISGDRATVQDCQDASESGQADARTGERRTVGIPRNPVAAQLRRGADKTWRVSTISYPGGTC